MDPTQQPEQPNNMVLTNRTGQKGKAATVASIVLGVFLAISLGALAWVYMQSETDKKKLNDEKAQLQAQIELLTSSESQQAEDQPATCSGEPSMEMMDNIKAALNTKNTAVFATYVTDPVTFVLAASEQGGEQSAADTAQSMAYTHSATGPWDFNLSAATLASYEVGFYKDYFDDTTYVGKAASGMVASFDFDCDGKIKQIFISADDDLLLES